MVEGGRRVYCVVQAELPPATTGARQRVTVEISRPSPPPPSQPRPLTAQSLAIVQAGVYTGGGTFAFSETRYETRYDPATARMVIVGRSAGAEYGYANTQAGGTFAVALGRWNPLTRSVEPPSAEECAATTVIFWLNVPKDPGVTVMPAEVQAYVADAGTSLALFGDSYREPSRTSYRALIGRASAGAPPDLTSRLCVAQAPVRLGDTVGYQRVVARVKRTAPGQDPTEEEVTLRTETAEAPAGATYFNPTRVHASPRPFVGAVVLPWGFDAEAESAGSSPRVTVSPVAGFDVPLEPFFRNPAFESLRLVVATELSQDFGEQLYVGVSYQSLLGIESTGSTLDVSFGLSARTVGEFQLRPTLGLLLDLQSSLKGIQGAFGL
jgi:hypothetical protein